MLENLEIVTFSSFTLKPLNFLLKTVTHLRLLLIRHLTSLTHPRLLLLCHSTSFLLILFHIDSSPLTHCSTEYYINPKYLPCIP